MIGNYAWRMIFFVSIKRMHFSVGPTLVSSAHTRARSCVQHDNWQFSRRWFTYIENGPSSIANETWFIAFSLIRIVRHHYVNTCHYFHRHNDTFCICRFAPQCIYFIFCFWDCTTTVEMGWWQRRQKWNAKYDITRAPWLSSSHCQIKETHFPTNNIGYRSLTLFVVVVVVVWN